MEMFIDEQFNRDFTRHYSLLLEAEAQQFTYVLYEKNTGKISLLKRTAINTTTNGAGYAEMLKNTIHNDDYLHLPFLDVKISIVLGGFTLVPEVLFEEDRSADYLLTSSHVTYKELTAVNTNSGWGIKTIFTMHRDAQKYLLQLFPSAQLYHVCASLIAYMYHQRAVFAASQLLLDVRNASLHIAYVQNEQLQYINQFHFKNTDDFMYYILLVCDQLHIDRNHCNLMLCGYITEDSMLYNALYKFFINISFTTPQKGFTFPAGMQEKLAYFYNTLLSLHLCA
jgi:hypothetical protein